MTACPPACSCPTRGAKASPPSAGRRPHREAHGGGPRPLICGRGPPQGRGPRTPPKEGGSHKRVLVQCAGGGAPPPPLRGGGGGPCPRSGRLAPPKGGPAPNRLPPLSLRARARAPTFNLVCFFVLALQMPPLGAQRAGGARPQARSPRARPGRLRSCRAPQLRDRGGAQRCVIEWYSALRHYFCWPCQCWLCQSLQLLHLGVLWKCSTYQVPSTCALARVY
jgi:hypothetical protein